MVNDTGPRPRQPPGALSFLGHVGAAFGIPVLHASHFKIFCRLKSRITCSPTWTIPARPIFAPMLPVSTDFHEVIRNKERGLFLVWGPAPNPPGFLRHESYRPMRSKRARSPSCTPVLIVSMSSPRYSSARLRPRRAGLRFTRCAQLTKSLIQLRSRSGSDTTFLLLPAI